MPAALTLDSLSVAKLLEAERGTRARGFADSMARKTERRILSLKYMIWLKRSANIQLLVLRSAWLYEGLS